MANLSAAEMSGKKADRFITFKNKIQNGEEFELDSGKKVVIGYSSSADDAKFKSNVKKLKNASEIKNLVSPVPKPFNARSTVLPVVGGGYVSLSSLKKTSEFGGGGGAATGKITGNRGDIAEGIFAAAIAARFVNKNKPVSKTEVLNMLKKLDAGKSGTRGAKGKGAFKEVILKSDNSISTVKDDVRLFLSLAAVNMQGLYDPITKNLMGDVFNSAIKYANSKTVMRWSKLLYENNKCDKIEVIADGIGDQTGTKVDVRVLINSKIVDINVSLKAGDVKQFGQVGGSSFDSQVTLWNQLVNVDVSSLETKYTELLSIGKVFDALYLSYNFVERKLNTMFKSKTNSKKVIKSLADGILYFATLRESDVTLVQLNNEEAKIYTFENLEKLLQGVELECEIKDSAGKPKMSIYPKGKPKSVLLEVRVKFETKNSYVRNYIEKGNYLGDLIAEYA